MRDLAPALSALCESGRRFALATVVAATGSTPRPVGTVMAVTADGEVLGSLSGGCVEAAVYDAAQAVLTTGGTSFETFGVSDDDAFAVGLTCGGVLEVLVSQADPALISGVLGSLAVEAPDALATGG